MRGIGISLNKQNTVFILCCQIFWLLAFQPRGTAGSPRKFYWKNFAFELVRYLHHFYCIIWKFNTGIAGYIIFLYTNNTKNKQRQINYVNISRNILMPRNKEEILMQNFLKWAMNVKGGVVAIYVFYFLTNTHDHIKINTAVLSSKIGIISLQV